MADSPDPIVEQLEAELEESRFKPWDVEKFLAKRHRAKIEALEASENQWARRWHVVGEVFWAIMAIVGWVSTMTVLGLWLLTGEFPVKP